VALRIAHETYTDKQQTAAINCGLARESGGLASREDARVTVQG
jgi:hypothetical protein